MIARIRNEIGRRFDWKDIGAVIAALLVGLLIFLVLWWKHDGDTRDHQRQQQINGLSRSNDALRKQVQQLGAKPVAPPAAKVKENPTAPIPTPTPSATAVGPSQDQVDAAVADYFKAHPPGPTPAEIAAAAVNYLQQHPPPAGPEGKPGAPPSADQMFTAVASFCGQDSNPCRGVKGDKGDPGPGPTADQMAQAVHDYVAANPLPMCPDGTSATAENVLTTTGPVDAVICVKG